MITLPAPQGLIERLTPEALPPGAAASAVNLDLSAGSIKGLNVTATTQLWSGTNLVGEAPTAEIVGPAKPTAAPVLKSLDRICQPATGTTLNWLSITARGWHVYDRVSGTEPNAELITERVEHTLTTTIHKVQSTPTGFKIYGTFGGFNYTATAATVYRHFGPNVQVTLTSDASGKGGPSAAEAGDYPETPTFSDPPIPGGAWALYDNDATFGTGQIYGHLRCAALDVEPFDPSYTAAQNGAKYCYGMDFVLTFDCEYSPGAVSQVRLVSAGVDADGREGPPSEESDLLTLPPGTRPTFTLAAAPSGGTRRLYVSGKEGSREWRLWADEILDRDMANGSEDAEGVWQDGDGDDGTWSGNDWTDDGREAQPVPVPPYGDYIGTGFTAAADLKKWSVMMGDFALCAVDKPDDGKVEIWPSDATRLHSWPEEWVKVIPATPRKGIVSLGTGEALVFAGSEVWLASGGDPRAIGLRKLSTEHGLLDLRSLCRIGGTVFWVTRTGLAACEGGAVRLISEPFISPEQWRDRSPEKYTAKTDGVSVILTHEGAGSNAAYNRRFVIKAGQVESVVAWTALTGGTPSWQSGVIDAGRPVILDARRMINSGDAKISFTADGAGATFGNQTDANGDPVTDGEGNPVPITEQTMAAASSGKIASLTPVGPARRWQFKLTGSSSATEIRWPVEFYERKIIDVPEGGITLTPEMIDNNWGDVWLKFADKGRFVAAMADGLTGAGIKLTFNDRSRTAGNAFSVSATPGRALKIADAKNEERELWRLSVTESDGSAISQPLAGLTLYTRRTRRIEGLLRETASGTGVRPWWITDYQFDGWVTSAKVLHTKKDGDGASVGVALTAILDGAEEESLSTAQDGALTSGTERLFDAPFKAGRLSFHFGEDDDFVQEVQIGTQRVIESGGGVIRISRGQMRGGLIHFPDRGALACFSVGARAYPTTSVTSGTPPVTVTTADTRLRIKDVESGDAVEIQVFDGKSHLVPRAGQKEGGVFQIDLTGDGGNAFELLIMPRQRVKVEGRVISLVANDTGFAPWDWQRYEVDGEVVSAQALSDASVTANIWKNGALASTGANEDRTMVAVSLDGASESEVRQFGTAQSIDVEIPNGDGYKINELRISLREVVTAAEGQVTYQGPFPMRRRMFKYLDQGKPCAAIIKARGYSDAALALYASGVQVDLDSGTAGTQSLAVTSGRPVIFPRALEYSEPWESDFANSDVTDSLTILSRRTAPVKDLIFENCKESGLYPWLGKEYKPEADQDYVSALVYCAGTPTLNVYGNGAAESPSFSGAVSNEVEIALTGLLKVSSLNYDFGGDDMDVGKVFIFPRKPIIFEKSIVLLRSEGVYNFINRRLESKKPFRLATARVKAESYPVALAFSSRGQALCNAMTVTEAMHDKAFTLPRWSPVIELDFSATGGKIEKLGLSVTATV